MTDLYAAYNELETLLAAQQQQNPDAELVIADISVKEENGNTSFVLTSGFGDDDGGGDPPTNIWYMDAAEVIQYTINSNTPQPVDGYWTSITTVYADPVRGYGYPTNGGVVWNNNYSWRNPNDPPTLDNWYDYLMFRNSSHWPIQNYHMYLIPAEMSFYTAKAFTICNTTMYSLVPPGLIQGKDFIGMEAEGGSITDMYGTTIFHKYDMSYGIAVYGGGGND